MTTSLSTFLLSLILPFFICVTMIIILKYVAQHVGLLDKPCARKQHAGLVPLVGGIAMFISFAISTLLLIPSMSTLYMVSVTGLIAALGVMDDMHGLRARRRFLVQVIAAVAMVYFGGVQLVQLGNIFGDGIIYLGAVFSLIFTVFCIVGVINAMNMMDGIDGLAGGIAFICFSSLAFISYMGGETQIAVILLTVVGSLVGFLLFNIQIFGYSARVFMGDAGSLFLGLLLAWFFIKISQTEDQILSPVAAGWFFGVPLLDASAVMSKRLLQGRSPFKAGRDHIHHLLLDKGFSVNETVGILFSLQLTFIAIGGITNNNQTWEPALFWLFIIMVATYISVTHKKNPELKDFSDVNDQRVGDVTVKEAMRKTDRLE